MEWFVSSQANRNLCGISISTFPRVATNPLIKCSTRKGYALSNPIQLIAKFRGSIKKCVARSACMGLDIENRHNRRRRARHGVCSSSRSSWPPRDLGLATCQSYRASSYRRNHSGRRDFTDLHAGATRSREPAARFSCRYLPGNCPPRADQDCTSMARGGRRNSARRLLGEPCLLFGQSGSNSGTLSDGSCVPRGRGIQRRRHDSICRYS